MSGTLYDVLGVHHNATPTEIKAAYRKLAKLYHPDRMVSGSADHQKFVELQNAYEILSKPLSRQRYDDSLINRYAQYQHQQTYSQPRYQPPPYYYRRSNGPKYSRRTYFYGALFVVGIVIFAFMFPTYLMIKSANSHFKKGIAYYDAGMYSQAMDNFTKSINEISGKSGLANYYQAYILFYHYRNYQITTKYIDLALDDLSEDSLISELYWMKGKCYHLAGKNSEALSFFDNVEDYGTAQDSAIYYSGIIHTVINKQYDKGLECFEAIIGRNKYHQESHYFKAYCLQKLENHDQAISIYNNLLDQKYEPGAVYFHRALSLLKLNQRDSACVDLDSAVNLHVADAFKLKSIYCP